MAKTKKVAPVFLVRAGSAASAAYASDVVGGITLVPTQRLASRYARKMAEAVALALGGRLVRLIRKARILRFEPVAQGFAYAWWKCRHCGNVMRYAYQPYSLANPIPTPCHGIGERDYGCDTITEKEARAYFLTKYDKVTVIDVKDSSLFSADSFIETLGMLAFDQVGDDLSDGWPHDPGKDAKAELERDVAKVMRAWIEKHDLSPSFYTIRDTSDHVEPDYPPECEHCKAEPTVVFEREITSTDGVVTGEIRVFSCSDCAGRVEGDTGAPHMKLDDWRVHQRLLAWRDQET